MAGFFQKQDRTTKPPLGTPLRADGHWNVQGLVGAWGLNESADRAYYNLVNGAKGLGRNNPLKWGPDCVSTTVYSNISDAQFNIIVPQAEFTILAKFKQTLSGGSQGYAVGLGVDAANGYSIGYAGGYTTNISARVQGAIVGANDIVSSGGLTLSTFGVTASSSANSVSFYRNGIKGNSAAWAASGVFSTVNILGDAVRTYNQGLSGDAYFIFIFSRALSPAEIASLSANPWQVYEPEVVWVEVGASGSPDTITGTLAITESPDTSAITGTLTLSGSLASTESPDTLAASGSLSISGAVAIAESPDSAVITGSVTISGAMAVTESGDVALFNGAGQITGVLAVVEGGDTAAMSGTVTILGTVDGVDGPDTVAITGTMTIAGTMAVGEAGDRVRIVSADVVVVLCEGFVGKAEIRGVVGDGDDVRGCAASAEIRGYAAAAEIAGVIGRI